MSDTLAILGYVPEWWLWRRQMLGSLHALWRLYALVAILTWLLPFRLGWGGVGAALWVTFWCAWARFWIWFAEWMEAQRR